MRGYQRVYRKRQPSGWFVAGGCVGILLVATALAFLNGLIIMLVSGGLHHSVSQQVPALPFWPSVLVGYALTFISSFFRGRS